MKTAREKIFDTLREKGCMKQNVYRNTEHSIKILKNYIEKLGEGLGKQMSPVDKSVVIEYEVRGEFEMRLKLGGDILIFLMHTNVFDFDKGHPIWNLGYVKEDPLRAYCGMISVYNFLADSFKYNRENDLGYLIARIFVNKDNHFFVEGKRQLGFLYNDFANQTVSREIMGQVVDSSILYSLSFDLLTPPYQQVVEVSVQEVNAVSQAARLKTGKRLGFQFQADADTQA